ncbi:MAG: hypothetical protein JW895_02780 [Thermoleophilaceae bacterium]|nr:hypothetical protein [Thermoleophilaceae bacterium]
MIEPGSPQAAAAELVKALHRHEALVAWRLITRDYRQALASRAMDHLEREGHLAESDDVLAIIEAIATDTPDEAHLPLVETLTLYLLDLLPSAGEPWGWAANPRPIEPDLELALLVRVDDAAARPSDVPATIVNGYGFSMRRCEGRWLLAGLDMLEGERGFAPAS